MSEIKFNYSAADAATGSVGTLVSAMKQNTANLNALYTALMDGLSYEGSAADGYQAVMKTFRQKIDTYDTQVEALKNKLGEHTNSGGTMAQIDIKQGNRFMGIKA
ncbi:WXG100 family type VII secretion target [Nocardia sp. NPDC051463]|uniref:WXG100 family type VII secretion target n=1 Tax=Nocardia sp. NPDC051463 TaxID=3154845 RepID=UPI00344A78F6